MPVSQFVFCQIHINMTNDCVYITKILMMGVKLMTVGIKNTHIKSKGQCKDKKVSQKEFIYIPVQQ